VSANGWLEVYDRASVKINSAHATPRSHASTLHDTKENTRTLSVSDALHSPPFRGLFHRRAPTGSSLGWFLESVSCPEALRHSNLSRE